MNPIQDVIAFVEKGGPVIAVILVVVVGIWAIIVERAVFVYWQFPAYRRGLLQRWERMHNPHSWQAQRIRQASTSQAGLALEQGLPTLKTLIALCPLLGLLGTVTGMIEVFDVVSVLGTGDARALASGISRATLPTMAGMLAALSGMYFHHSLQQRALHEKRSLQDKMY